MPAYVVPRLFPVENYVVPSLPSICYLQLFTLNVSILSGQGRKQSSSTNTNTLSIYCQLFLDILLEILIGSKGYTTGID